MPAPCAVASRIGGEGGAAVVGGKIVRSRKGVNAAMGKVLLNRSNGCWLDVFDAERFTGNMRRLHGPAEYPGLRIREKEWGDSLASLNVGPSAYVQCFDSRNFYESVFWLLPNQAVESCADIDCGDTIDSIRLYDRPPFAHEGGYAAYMLWAASHLAKLKE